ncbi:FMN-linked oxidoreductase [Linderina pennispora]|uniref:FMN-linked oxidoreductase n=1 Tax=Linderina pennispora TaxID=61395 RepID=A0A1Y1W1R2_9FUNG|nr:FMN-linked oxidoreductase [Linderina pennispora]ORX67215.1 FMN-linked oxidoreductase [Linderina pennispora]
MVDDDTRKAWRDRYRNGNFLAPMVRLGTLPMRLLCLEYGADLVWSPEIVDQSVADTERVVDEQTGVVRYIKNNRDMFTTHPNEKDKLIFQLGSAAPESALAAAKKVMQDVSGFDLNCGCPKQFSLQGGMGAALMTDPDRLCSILDILVKNIDLPITCKIRVFDDEEKTLALVKRVVATGISALTVHCRTKDMRPREPAMWKRLDAIVKAVPDIPVILNGDVFNYEDFDRARRETGAASAMSARGVVENASVFRSAGKLPAIEVAHAYIENCVRMANNYTNTKYSIMQMYTDTKSQVFVDMRSAKCYRDLCAALGLSELYENVGTKVLTERLDLNMNKNVRGKPATPSGKNKRAAQEARGKAPGADNVQVDQIQAKRIKT